MNEQFLSYKPEVLKRLQEELLDIMTVFDRFCREYDLPYFLAYGSAIGAVRHQGFIPWDDDLDVGMLRADYEKFMALYEAHKVEEPYCGYEILSVKTTPENCSPVTKLQKKNTTFIAWHSRDLKNHIGIGMDIFPFDRVEKDPEACRNHMRMANFWDRLLFLRGTAYPNIPMKGIAGEAAKMICFYVHHALKAFKVPSTWIFRKFEKCAAKLEHSDLELVTCMISPEDYVHKWRISDLYPPVEAEFEGHKFFLAANNHEILTDTYGDYMELPPEEKRVNHRPYKISFTKEL